MPGEKVPKEKVNLNSESSGQSKEKESISIDAFNNRVCYFSLSGDLALKAFYNIRFSTFKADNGRKKLKNELIQRLNFAVLMFDKVVMHCSDPLRSEVVLEVLEENIEWIKNGHIVFIFSKQINDIKSEYKKYIDNKINDYSEGYCSEKEAASLKQEHITNEYYERVIKVLCATDCLVRKTSDSNCSFAKLVINDLDPNFQTENVVIDSYANLSQILSLNLSLFQLLHMRHLKCRGDEEKEVGHFVFPQLLVNDVIDEIKDCLEQGNTIARSAIVDSLEEELKKNGKRLTTLQKNVLKAITLRMDILYCKMNSGKQLILEFHPLYEKRSNYQIDCFSEYLKLVTGSKKKILLTPAKINKILNEDSLNYFRHIYLSCMADTREYIKLAFNGNDTNQYQEPLLEVFRTVVAYNSIVNDDLLKLICNILKEEF